MAKKWIKFLKDHKQDDKTSFTKDQVILLEDDDTLKGLLTLKMAQETEAPSVSDEIKKQLEASQKLLDEAIEDMVTKALAKSTEALGKKAKGLIVNVTKDETPFEKYSRSFNNEADYFMTIIKSSQQGAVIDERFSTKAPSGINTLDDTEGGFLIPDTIASGIWSNVQENQASILPRTDQRQTSGNNMKFLRTAEVSRKAGYRHMGMAAYWTEEAGDFVASQPKWSKWGLDLHKITVLCYVTEEELADAATAVVPVISRMAAQAINFLVDESFIWGTGVGKPTGIMRSDALITVSKTAAQANGTISHNNIHDMYYRLHPSYRSGAVWMVNANLEEKLGFLTFNDVSGGTPIFFQAGNGFGGLANANLFGTMMGLPVIPCEYCSDLGTKGDIILANWKEYISLTKTGGGIKFAESIHVRFLYEERAFRFSFRVGGGSPWSAPIEDYKGSKTRGPFVTLEDRSATPTSSGL